VWQNAVIAVCFQRFWWRHDPAKMRILAEKQYWWDTMVYLFQSGMLGGLGLQMHSLRFLIIQRMYSLRFLLRNGCTACGS
jgi:hypothetical protein